MSLDLEKAVKAAGLPTDPTDNPICRAVRKEVE